MKIKWIVMGKTEDPCVKKITDEYLSRIKRMSKIEYIELPGIKNTKKLSPDVRKIKEGEMLKKYLKPNDYIILLDENGKEFTSKKWAKQLEKLSLSYSGTLTFIIGSAYGFSEEIYKLSHEKLSLSKMTFSHQIIRIFFAEQLYRALTIIQGHPYHND